MQKRILGTQGLTVSAQGLGCMGMSEFYGPTDVSESIATLELALDLGIAFWDTADIYGPWTNEELLGRVLIGRRDHVVLATKFGILRGEDKSHRGYNASPEYVKTSCEASLKRLKTDYIDLYYLHRLDPHIPIEDTVGAMAELVQEGKVRYLGLSEVSGSTLRRAAAVHPISAVQSEYSLWSRDVEETLFPTLRELNVGFVPYSPLGRGFLTGTLKSPEDLAPDDFRRMQPRFQEENFYKNLELVELIQTQARHRGCTPAQLALAWVLAQGEHFVPIPGTRHQKYLLDNAKALEIELTAEERQALDHLSAVVEGERYHPAGMQAISRS